MTRDRFATTIMELADNCKSKIEESIDATEEELHLLQLAEDVLMYVYLFRKEVN